jgi:hypothetical protein
MSGGHATFVTTIKGGRCWKRATKLQRLRITNFTNFRPLLPLPPRSVGRIRSIQARDAATPCNGSGAPHSFCPHPRAYERVTPCSLPPSPQGALVRLCLFCNPQTMPSGVNIPSANLDFAWDRPETADSLRERLLKSSRSEWLRLAAWILREARVEEVWQFLTLREVADAFPHLCGRLGHRRSVWEHLLKAAHELGRL